MVVHSGASSECGHYYCYSRHSQVGDVESVIDSLDKASSNGSQNTEASDLEKSADMEVDFLEDKWCLFNDSRVSHATYASFSSVTRRFQKDTPYVLVYRKLSLDSHDAQPPVDPPLSQELRDAVNKDNTQYLKVRKYVQVLSDRLGQNRLFWIVYTDFLSHISPKVPPCTSKSQRPRD